MRPARSAGLRRAGLARDAHGLGKRSMAGAGRMAHHHRHSLANPLNGPGGPVDPPRQADYQQRAAAYLEQLRSAEAAIRRLLTDLPRRDIATFHRAFDYFAEAYGLHVVAVFTPAPGREPGPRYVEAFQRQVRAHRLRVVFIEPQMSEAALSGIAQDLGLTLRQLDPLGGMPGVESYIAMMQFNAAQIAAALQE